MHDGEASRAKPDRDPSGGSSPVSYPFRFEASAEVAAPAESLFAYLDDPRNAAAHMRRPSWQVGGARMTIETDEGGAVPPAP
jgi:hypothetical protein